jgi:hypothetical protein
MWPIVSFGSSPFRCFHTPHAPSDTTCTPPFFCTHAFASAVHKEMYQSPPKAIFSAVAMADLFLNHFDPDPQSISCPIPARS